MSETDDGPGNGRDDHDDQEQGNGNGYGNGGGGGKDDDCGCGESSPECPDCDPDLFDDHKCRREGIKAQADYNDTAGPVLEQAAKDYETARKAYRDKRMEIDKEVKDLGEEIGQLIDRIKCLIKDDGVIDCLDKAYRCVVRKLKDCKHDGGCCSTGPCDYDGTCPEDDKHHVDYNELVRKISDYERRLKEEKDCFDLLKGEPDALKGRLDKVQAEIEAVKATLGGDQDKVDLKKLYVDALVARRHLALLWNGFDSVQAYIDCLCRSLTCWIKASEALSALQCCLAVEDCKKRTREEYCQRLNDDTAVEILLAYERICGCRDGGGDDGGDDGGGDDGGGDDGGGEGNDDGDDDPECGCDHGHQHRRSHHHHGHDHDDSDTTA
jgi:hypothetical protein